MDYQGANPQDDVMERLLRVRRGRLRQKKSPAHAGLEVSLRRNGQRTNATTALNVHFKRRTIAKIMGPKISSRAKKK